jgi:hypothetical protein
MLQTHFLLSKAFVLELNILMFLNVGRFSAIALIIVVFNVVPAGNKRRINWLSSRILTVL